MESGGKSLSSGEHVDSHAVYTPLRLPCQAFLFTLFVHLKFQTIKKWLRLVHGAADPNLKVGENERLSFNDLFILEGCSGITLD
jgi:hypothetical protein